MCRRWTAIVVLAVLVLAFSSGSAFAASDVTRYVNEYAYGQWGMFTPDSTAVTAGVWNTELVRHSGEVQESTVGQSAYVTADWAGELPDGTHVTRMYRAQFSDAQCSVDSRLGIARIWGTSPSTVTQWVDGESGSTTYQSTMTIDLTMAATGSTQFNGYGGHLEADVPTNMSCRARKVWALVVSGQVASGDGVSLAPSGDDGSDCPSYGELSLFRYHEVVLPTR
mgnify:CR=1 FL=1